MLINSHHIRKYTTDKQAHAIMSRMLNNPHIPIHYKQVKIPSRCKWGECEAIRVLAHVDLEHCLNHYRTRVGDGTGQEGYKHILKYMKRYLKLFEDIADGIKGN